MRERMARVPAEHFVGALPAEAHLHVLRCEAAHVVHRKERGADHRLILKIHEALEVLGECRAVERDQIELQSERLRGRFLKRPLVDDALAAEVNAKAVELLAAVLRERGDRGGVDPSAEERANRNVGHELLADDVLQRVFELAHAQLGRHLFVREAVDLPVRARPRATAIDLEVLARPELLDVFEKGALEERRVKMEILVEPRGIDVARDARALKERFNLAGEDDALAVVVVVELLHAERIAREDQAALTRVPVREREDARDVLERARSVAPQEMKERLGVRRPPKTHALRLEPRAKLRVVVRLPVVRDGAAVVGEHRLLAGRREIDDREATVAEPERPREMESFVVGTAMPERARHAHDEIAIRRARRLGVVEDPRDSAHRLLLLFSRLVCYSAASRAIGNPSRRLRTAMIDAHVTP